MTLLIPLLLALLVVDLAVYRPLDGPVAPTARQPAPLPLADVNPIGANLFMNKEVDSFKKDKTMSLLYAGGFTWIKQQFPWPEIDITEAHDFYDSKNGKSSWQKFDDIVQRANSLGMHIIARIDRAPSWARADGTPDFAPPRDPELFADFVKTFVARYKGKVQAIQIWNEPNLANEWLGDRVDPAGYAALLKAAYKKAKEADPNIIVLSAPLSITNEEGANLRETLFLERMYRAFDASYAGDGTGDCRHCFDVLSANGFGLDRPPEDPPSPDVLNFRRVELLRQVMEEHGDSAKPVWFTEYGWNAAPDTLSPDEIKIWRNVTQVQQADYTVRGIRYARENWPWAGVFTLWYFRQVGDIPPSKAEYYFGLVTPEFVPEPVYYSVQALAQELATGGPGRYGPLSAPVQANGSWSLTLKQDGDGAQTPLLVSTSTTSTLSLQFEGTDVAMDLAVAGGDSTPSRVYVTVDGGSAGVATDLPRDEAGRPYVDSAALAALSSGNLRGLAAPQSGPATISLVRDLGRAYAPVKHQLQLSASGPGVQIAGFNVSSARSLVEFWIVTLALLAMLVTDIVLLRRWRAP